MYRLDEIAPLAIVLLFHLATSHAGVQLGQERTAEAPVNAADPIEGSGQTGRVAREQSGLGNRQELHMGDKNGRIVVDQVIQKQAGVGNRQMLNLGATDQ